MGALALNRETSKELGDRMAGRYPVPPADVNNTYLVEHMVRVLCVCSCNPDSPIVTFKWWRLTVCVNSIQICVDTFQQLFFPHVFLHFCSFSISCFTELVAKPCQEAPHDDSPETPKQHRDDFSGEHYEQPR